MRIKDIKEKYDPEHECTTPGANYSSRISGKKVSMEVELPIQLNLSKKESEDLEAELHYAFEEILSKFFKDKNE